LSSAVTRCCSPRTLCRMSFAGFCFEALATRLFALTTCFVFCSVGTLVLASGMTELFSAHESQKAPVAPTSRSPPRPLARPPAHPRSNIPPNRPGSRTRQRDRMPQPDVDVPVHSRPISAPSDFNMSLDQASLCSVKTAAASLRQRPNSSGAVLEGILQRKLPSIK
jgi:hypothetical protein